MGVYMEWSYLARMMKMVISNPIYNSEGKMDKVNRQNQKELDIVWHKIFMCVKAGYTMLWVYKLGWNIKLITSFQLIAGKMIYEMK